MPPVDREDRLFNLRSSAVDYETQLNATLKKFGKLKKPKDNKPGKNDEAHCNEEEQLDSKPTKKELSRYSLDSNESKRNSNRNRTSAGTTVSPFSIHHERNGGTWDESIDALEMHPQSHFAQSKIHHKRNRAIRDESIDHLSRFDGHQLCSDDSEIIPLNFMQAIPNSIQVNSIQPDRNANHSTSMDKIPDYFISEPNDDVNINKIQPKFLFRQTSGFIWRVFGLKFAEKQLETEPWPIFTLWMIAMEIIIMLMLIGSHGFSTFNLNSRQEVSDFIMYQDYHYEQATYYEHPNMWLGPRYADLIYEGAKFSPCMRKDKTISMTKELRKQAENEYGCCLRSDSTNLQCNQAPRDKCSNRTSYWIKSLNGPGPLCGQDPKYCLDPPTKELDFSVNVTDWPICRRYDWDAMTQSSDINLKCDVQTRPCCIGIYGKCLLTSKSYCDFMKGKYHRDASLCSQVDCMENVCNRLLYPYQIYRLILSLFIHAGLIQLGINIAVQYVYMRRVEQLLGPYITMLIYLISGVGGNLASALFLPLTPDVGPNASLIGLISFLLYEIYRQRDRFESFWWITVRISTVLLVLLLPGLFLPFVDIFSITFGLLYGACTMLICYPRFTEHKESSRKNLRITAFIVMIVLTTVLGLLFFLDPDFMESIQAYTKRVNCIPLPFNLGINCSDIDIAYVEIKTLN